ncbi:MAG: hypothetical protein H6732_09125 [Alphaproteobacteria bacterium]|nr:hypothetical protein [Alphaproteobacteria bacterium]
MPVPLGFPPEASVLTPDGPRPLGSIQPGDRVLAVDAEARTLAPARVVAVREEVADQLVTIETDGHTVPAAAPGTGFYDAFEELFRAAGSLSALSELLVVEGQALEPRVVLEVPERDAPGARVLHLVLEAPAHALVVDGVVVRHKEG